MTAPTVSVALCTHNGARFIGEQLQSILTQSVLPDEIVLSDDASSDDTVGIAMRALEGSTVRLRVRQNAVPLGVTRNFEQAICASTSEFVVLSDQDDRWHPDRVEKALALFAKRPELSLVHSDALLVDEAGSALGATTFEALGVSEAMIETIHGGGAFALLARRNLVTGATTMIRRGLAAVAAPFPDGWVHDEWLAIVAASRNELDVIAEPLVDYRQHGTNQIGVAKLGFGGKLGRMLEPGADRNRRLLERATSLAERLPNIAPEFSASVEQKLEHERLRSSLRPARLARIAPLLRELRTGRYGAFGRGPADAVRDLLQQL